MKEEDKELIKELKEIRKSEVRSTWIFFIGCLMILTSIVLPMI